MPVRLHVPGCQCISITREEEMYFEHNCNGVGLSFVPNYVNNKTLNIWLGTNMIEVLPGNAFASCLELEQIYLQDNQIQSLPENIFANNVHLAQISLQRNQISSLPKNIFASNVNLNVINLLRNKIQWSSVDILANNLKITNVKITLNCNCLQTSVYNFLLELEVTTSHFECVDSSDHIRFLRVVNCTDSSMITLYSSSKDNQDCPCENKTASESSTLTTVNEVATANSVPTEASNSISDQSTGVTTKTKISLSAESIETLSTETTNSFLSQSTESVSTETQNKLSFGSTESVSTLKHLSSKPTDWMTLGTRYLAFSISLGVLAGVVAATVMAVNVLSNKFTQINNKKIPEMENGDADILLEVVMEDCEIDFAAFEIEVIEAQMLNIPPICHMYSTYK